jgi:hypothetical protein
MPTSYVLKFKDFSPKIRQSDALWRGRGKLLGVTEAILLEHGFTIEMLDALVRDGLFAAAPNGTVTISKEVGPDLVLGGGG